MIAARTKLLIIVGVTLLLAVAVFFRRSTPSSLHIHLQSLPWESVTIESANLPEPRRFGSRSDELLLSPIAHGIYRITIHLPDGRSVWASYLHHDAGVRRRVDLFVSPSVRAGYIRFRQTANRTDELFSGDTRPEDTAEDRPFQLDWI
ncbi:hypothetical protein ACXR0O_25130 [Verrucomicrobiota bacterium sgz303538]